MSGRECYHCKQWIEEGEAHDCWTTTERALTEDLSDDLQEAWQRFREASVDIGEQRIYASGTCIMFARKVCHFFVRPKKSFLEVVIILGRPLKTPQVLRVETKTKIKFANIVQIRHRDQVEPPITDWLREAYELPDILAAKPRLKTKGMLKPKAALKPKVTLKARPALKPKPTPLARAAKRKSVGKAKSKPGES